MYWKHTGHNCARAGQALNSIRSVKLITFSEQSFHVSCERSTAHVLPDMSYVRAVQLVMIRCVLNPRRNINPTNFSYFVLIWMRKSATAIRRMMETDGWDPKMFDVASVKIYTIYSRYSWSCEILYGTH